MKRLTFLFLCSLMSMGLAIAQNRQVTGTVIDDIGEPVIGASVIAKGTTTGSVTGMDGTFSLSIPASTQTLVVKFIGMTDKEVAVSDNMRIVLASDAQALNEVVVTAMGITREKKSLGYAYQELKSDKLIQGANSDLAGALQGKTSGLSIRPSSGMPGASSQITIRGARSFSGDNSPLYVIDGMPISSTPDVGTGDAVSGTDYSNRAVDIDPNDIETVNILKGQAASALYGIRASNGVIVITTKSGKGIAKGKPQVTFSSNVSIDKISRFPELQTTYAQGTKGGYSPSASMSWGPKITELPNDPGYGGNVANKYNGQNPTDATKGKYYVPQRANAGLDPWATPGVYNNIKDYFDTGTSWNNSLNVAQATEKSSYAFSLGSSNVTGIIPTTGMDRYNAKLVAQTELTKQWETGFTASYINTSIKKMPSANDGIVATVYPAPPSYDLAGIPQHYAGNPYKINNYRGGSFPAAYWALDNTNFTEKTSRFFGNAFIDFTTKLGTENQKLNVKYQLGTDSYVTNYEDLWGYGIKGTNNNGQVEDYNWTNVTFNSLLTATYDWSINENWRMDAMLGNEAIQDNRRFIYAAGQNFQIPGWNHIGNALVKDATTEENWTGRTVGFFGSISASYKNMLYLSATGRKDYVSNMPRNSRSFFYPSASLGFILTELESLKHNSIMNFAKIRTSYAEVGQASGQVGLTSSYKQNYYSVPTYGSGFYNSTPIQYPINGINGYTPYFRIYDPNLIPQNTRSYEVGFDLGLMDNLFTINYTFSRQNVTDQIFSVPLAGSTGSSSLLTNGGSMHTNAHELTVGMNPIRGKNINLDFAFNWTKLDNYVDALAPGVESIMLGGFVTPQVRASIGDRYPVIYGVGYKRDDQGHILVDGSGMPEAGEPQVIGKVSPDFMLGFNTNLRINKFGISAVLDWKSGGQMYGGTNGLLNYYGISKETEGREGSFIVDGYKKDGTKNDIAISGPVAWQGYYNVVNNIDEAFIYNNSFIKLRELAVNYQILKKQNLELSVNAFARNILLWTNLPNLDPESSQGNSNMVGAFERFSLPQTSSYGLGLNIKF